MQFTHLAAVAALAVGVQAGGDQYHTTTKPWITSYSASPPPYKTTSWANSTVTTTTTSKSPHPTGPGGYCSTDGKHWSKNSGDCPPGSSYSCSTNGILNIATCINLLNGNTIIVPLSIILGLL